MNCDSFLIWVSPKLYVLLKTSKFSFSNETVFFFTEKFSKGNESSVTAMIFVVIVLSEEMTQGLVEQTMSKVWEP